MLSELRLERKYADGIHVEWSPKTLHQLLDQELPGAQVIVVSNREPYIHNRVDGGVVRADAGKRPRLGARAGHARLRRRLGRAWLGIARTGRRSTARDRVAVPPDASGLCACGASGSATRSRTATITVSPTRGSGRFAISPSCGRRSASATGRITSRSISASPTSSSRRRTATTRSSSCRTITSPCCRACSAERLPRATIIAFWHIPWPNPETFGICPWRDQIIDGLLGSSILGFHTQFHCNNFIEAVDRFMESRIDRERSSVTLGGHETLVRPYPISIEWPPAALARQAPVEECRRGRREPFRAERRYADRGRDRTLRLHQGHRGPHAGGRRSAGIAPRSGAASSSSSRPRRRRAASSARTETSRRRRLAEAEAINARWGDGSYKPIVLVHSPP